MKPKLSIIVPVYNVEQFVEQCVGSLLHPTEDNYEIIIINDGTKDRSIDIIQNRFHDKRIRIVDKENGGLSSARNRGVKESQGKYIWFFDSDDWAETELIPEIIKSLDNNDIIAFNSRYENDGDNERIIKVNRQCKSGRELACVPYVFGAPFYIYSYDFLVENNLFFKEGILHEDALFTPIAILRCNKVCCLDKPVYHYRKGRGDSITSTFASPKRLADLIFVLSELIKLGQNVNKEIRYKWGRCIAQVTNELLFCSMHCNEETSKKDVRRFVNRNWVLLPYLLHSSRNNKILAFLTLILMGDLYLSYSLLYKLKY